MRCVIVKGSGGAGLGDRLQGVIGAIAYALLTKRSLFVDWKDTAYGDGTRNYFPDLFTLTGVPSLNEMPTNGTVSPPAWRDRLQMSLNEIVGADSLNWSREAGRLRYSLDQRRQDYDEDILVMWELDFFDRIQSNLVADFPEFKSLTAEESFAQLFQRHVKLRPELIERAQAFRDSNLRPGHTVGVHVRRTAECDANRPNPGTRQFLEATRKLLKADRNRVVFLATDNQSVTEHFHQEFGASRIVSLPKWMPSAGMHMHMNPDCPDPLQAAKDALVDAWLLGQCDYLVTSKCSGFSWLARLNSKAPAANRITLAQPLPWSWAFRKTIRAIIPGSIISLFRSTLERHPSHGRA